MPLAYPLGNHILPVLDVLEIFTGGVWNINGVSHYIYDMLSVDKLQYKGSSCGINFNYGMSVGCFIRLAVIKLLDMTVWPHDYFHIGNRIYRALFV